MIMMIDPLKSGNLPQPVARYLRRVLRGNHLPIAHAEFYQVGTLRTSLESEHWRPFTARHVVIPAKTEFTWDADLKVFPFVQVGVRDAYVVGRGHGEMRLFGKFTVVRQQPGTPINEGSLHRYLAEAVWYPTALLPSDVLSWTSIDDTRALATLTNAGATVSLEFRFSPSGAVSSIYTPARWGLFPEGYIQVPWEGRFYDYELHDGLIVPRRGEVGWYAGDTWMKVWIGQITSARYDFTLQQSSYGLCAGPRPHDTI